MNDEWGKGAKYWDAAWNPMIGCRKVSEGCANCYAARLAAQYPELQSADGGFEPHPPKHLKRPPKSGVVFCGNMTDLFGEWNTNADIHGWIDSLSPKAHNLILTKRPERMMSFFGWGRHHLFFGITAENQDRLYERLWKSEEMMIWGLWLSLEPLLGNIDLQKAASDAFKKIEIDTNARIEHLFRWVVVGAESGPNRRPCSLDWVRQIVQQCQKAEVPVFVKQLDIDGKLVKDIEKFPEDLQIRQVPWGVTK